MGRAADRPGYSGGARVQCQGYSGGGRVQCGGDSGLVEEVCGDGGFDFRGSLGQAEVVEQHRDREHRRSGVSDRLPGDVGGAAVHRLKHAGRSAGRVDVATCRQADAPGNRGAEVGEDVAEQVVGDDHVEPLRVGHEVDGRGIDMAVVDGNVREIGTDGVNRAGPEI